MEQKHPYNNEVKEGGEKEEEEKRKGMGWSRECVGDTDGAQQKIVPCVRRTLSTTALLHVGD